MSQTMTPERAAQIMRDAELWQQHQARSLARGNRSAFGSMLRHEYYAGGGGGGRLEGILSEMTPSQRSFAAHVLLRADRDPNFRKQNPKGMPIASQIRASLQASGVRFNTGETDGIGSELVEVCPEAEIWDSAMCGSEIIERLGGLRPASGKSVKIINLTSLPEAYHTPPAEDCTELDCRTTSPIGTRIHEHDAEKISIDICMPAELDEDSAMDVITEYTDIAERAIRRATENAVIRGDTTLSPANANINHDGTNITLTATGQAPAYTSFDGIAHATLIDNDANNAANATPGFWTPGDPINADAVMKARILMDDPNAGAHWGFCDTGDLIYITDSLGYASALTMEDVKWVDRVGDMATVVTGQLPMLHGVPIYLSTALRPTDIDGLIDTSDSTNNTYGQWHIVNRGAVRVGRHRDLEIIVEVNKKCDVITITLQWRLSVARRSSATTAAGIEGIASLYGIAA